MTKYLIANDFKKMIKILLYIYPFAVFFGAVSWLVKLGENTVLQSVFYNVFASLTYSAVAAILVNMFLHILRVFINNFYKDECYLTHTLPVTKNQLLLSKYISALAVVVTSISVCAVSLFLVLNGAGFMEFMKSALQSGVGGFQMPVWQFLVTAAVLILLQICALISFAFTAVIKANMYNEKRAVKGLLWFALFYFGAMAVTFIVALLVFAIRGNISELFSSTISQDSLMTVFITAIVMHAIYTAVFFVLSQKLFNKGVNVD